GSLGARMGRGDVLEASDVAHTGANAELDSLSQRPVGPPQRTAQVIDAVAQHDTRIIHCIAETREPGCARDDAVELIAVHDEETLASTTSPTSTMHSASMPGSNSFSSRTRARLNPKV